MAYNLLKGKRGIIFGALNEKSIAWKVAERAVEDILKRQDAECCDILTLGKMYAVAVYGSSDKADCERFERDNRDKFKQSWVHTPKRFK